MGEFHNNKAAKDGKQSKCIACKSTYANSKLELRRIYMQGYRVKNAERLCDQERVRNLGRYGLTPTEFDIILSNQDGACASCGTSELGNGYWHVDHDHSRCSVPPTCGDCNRGILCPRCNKGIGMFEDNADLLIGAAAYLIRTGEGTSPNHAALLQGTRKDKYGPAG